MMEPVKPFTIRDAQPDDQAAIREVTLAAYGEYAQVMTPSAWAGLRKVVLAALATTVTADNIIAERDGTIVGSVMLFSAEVDAYGGLFKQAAVPELRLLAVTAEAVWALDGR
jgi:predicted N-acetyltransferase YhbS